MKVEHLVREIMTLPEGERQQLAREVLPSLLMTKVGLEGIDQALQALSEEELDALVERARNRNRDVPEETVAAVIGEALKATRAASRS